MKKIIPLFIFLFTILGCANSDVVISYTKWEDTYEYKTLIHRQIPVPFPNKTDYDTNKTKRSIYLHGFMTGWDYAAIYNSPVSGPGIIIFPYYYPDEDLDYIWHEGVEAGVNAYWEKTKKSDDSRNSSF